MYQTVERKESEHCLICFQYLPQALSFSFFYKKSILCQNCQRKLILYQKEILINQIPTFFLYQYNSFMKTVIYRYKGCYDYPLKDVFLYPFIKELKRKYKGYTILFPPSNKEEELVRGFQHIKEIIKCLKLPIEDLFIKKEFYKQSSVPFRKKTQIKKIIALKQKAKLVDKKYLIVDDIYTSGNTLKTIYALMIANGVKCEHIRGLIVAKVVDSADF